MPERTSEEHSLYQPDLEAGTPGEKAEQFPFAGTSAPHSFIHRYSTIGQLTAASARNHPNSGPAPFLGQQRRQYAERFDGAADCEEKPL